MTSLYDKPARWLLEAHRELDEAVAKAYGWAEVPADEEALARLLEMNIARSGASAPKHRRARAGPVREAVG